MRPNWFFLIIAMALLLAMAGIVSATTVTQNITYQGKLTDSNGNPLTGTYFITFKLYDVASGGTPLSMRVQSVPVTNGEFTTPVTFDSNIFDGRALWIGIAIGSDAEMTPRQEIRPVPYALGLRAGAIIEGGGAPWAFTVHNDGTDAKGINVTTTGANSNGVDAYTLGDNSSGIYGESKKYAGVKGKGYRGGIFETNQNGIGLIEYDPTAIVVNATYPYNKGIEITMGYEGKAIDINLDQYGSEGIDLIAQCDETIAFHSFTHGNNSPVYVADTLGDNSQGFYGQTRAHYTAVFYGKASGPDSHAVEVDAWGPNGDGVHSRAMEEGGRGVYGESRKNAGIYGKGVWGGIFETNQAGHDTFIPNGIWVNASYDNNRGIIVTTDGTNSPGYSVETIGDSSPGMNVVTNGVNSDGISVYSGKGYGIKANTGLTNGYGFYSDDYIWARGIHTPSVDVAEYMPVTEDVEPGTVMVIGPDGILTPSTSAYDTGVAGIVSTSPGVTLGSKEQGNIGEEMIAVAGRVPCKVDATTSPIHAGDLLCTSDRPGYAMKAEPVDIGGIQIYRPGTILGKAMGTLESGTGTIEVIVTLQ